MNLHRALSDIAEIRAQLDRTETYKGFRSTAVGVSVLILLVGFWLQSKWVVNLNQQVDSYLWIWLGVAVASASIASVEMLIRSRVSGNPVVGKMHWALASQIAPSFLVGFVLTVLVGAHAYEQAAKSSADGMIWALPGIWAMLYSLGLFNCRRHLPDQATGVAIYLLFAGVMLLGFNWMTREAAGWQMLVTFGVAQTYLGIVLYWNLERRSGSEER